MKKMCISFFVAIAASAVGTTFNTDHRFSISLPDNWVEIPYEALDGFSANIAERYPDRDTQFYDYGYQLGESGKWLTYPYILVQVKYVGRIPSGELGRYVNLKTGMTEGLEQVEDEFSDVLSDASMGEPVYDKENQMLWTSLTMKLHGDGNVKSIIAVKLTEYGLIQLNGYATEDTFEEYKAVFKSAFANLILDESIKYKPQITDSSPVVGNINLGKVLVVFLQASLVGGVLWLLTNMAKRRLKKA